MAEAGYQKAAKKAIRRLPEVTWDAHVWLRDGNHCPGTVDIADRQRIVAEILAVLGLPGRDASDG